MQISGLGAVSHTFPSAAPKKNASAAAMSGDVVSFSAEALKKSAQLSPTDVLDVTERMFFNEAFGMDVLNTAKGSVSEFASSFMSQQEINFFEQFQSHEAAYQDLRTMGVSLSI